VQSPPAEGPEPGSAAAPLTALRLKRVPQVAVHQEKSKVSRGFYICLLASLSVTLALAPIVASADTGRGQLLVSVTVIRECSIAIQNVGISGSATGQSTAMARGVVALSCSRNTGYDVSLGSGVYSPGTAIPASISGVGNGTPQLIPVYSQVPTRISEANAVNAGILTMTITY